MLLILALACICPLVSSDMCVVCQRGKYNTYFSNSPCKFCEIDTYAPIAGMTACRPCVVNSTAGRGSASCACLPGMTWNVELTKCIPLCPDGFVRNTADECMSLSNGSLVLNVEMTLMIPQNATSNEVESAIKSGLSKTYGVPKENLVITVTVLPVARRRTLLQETNTVRFAVEVRVLFPVDATNSDIMSAKTRLASINTSELSIVLEAPPTGISIKVVETGPVQVSKFSGIPSESSATTTSPIPSTSPLPSEPSEAFDMVLLVVIGCAGILIVLVLIFCICKGIHMPGHQ